jgi:hypothetical protein
VLHSNLQQAIPTIDELLKWVVGGGSFIIANWFASWFLEEFAFWKELQSKVKTAIIFVIALSMGVGASYLSLHQDIYASIAPVVNPVLLMATGWIVLQYAHRKNPKRIEEEQKEWNAEFASSKDASEKATETCK